VITGSLSILEHWRTMPKARLWALEVFCFFCFFFWRVLLSGSRTSKHIYLSISSVI
jgi:hypothetical protein